MLQFEHPCLQTETLNCARGMHSRLISCWISQLFKAEVCWRQSLSRHPDPKPMRYLLFQVWGRPLSHWIMGQKPRPVNIKRHTAFYSPFCAVREWWNESPRLFCNWCFLTISEDWVQLHVWKGRNCRPLVGACVIAPATEVRLWGFFQSQALRSFKAGGNLGT